MRYRRRAPDIEAIHWLGVWDAMVEWLAEFAPGVRVDFHSTHSKVWLVVAKQGMAAASQAAEIGDWLVLEQTGILRVFSDGRFRELYEPVGWQ